MEKQNGGHAAKARLRDATEVAPPSLEDLGIEKTQSHRWQKEATVPEEAFEDLVTKCREEMVELTQAALLKVAGAGHVSQACGENEWYTPPDLIERARRTMGGIDLDPASSEVAQRNVQAKRFYSLADDGLSKKWTGRVWMNPPYSKELCVKFSDKLLGHVQKGHVKQACVLVNNATETAWMQRLLVECEAVCFPSGRIQFLNKTGQAANSPLQGQAILYFGPRHDAFEVEFQEIGTVFFH